MSCLLHHVHRFDKFSQSRVEPVHYPTTMSTAYKASYEEKKPKSDLLASTVSKPRLATANPISHMNKELTTKQSVAKADYQPKDLNNNVWVRDTKSQSKLDHVGGLLANYSAPTSTAYRDFLAGQHEPDFTRAKVRPGVGTQVPAGEKRSVYNNDYRLKIAGMPTYEIAKKNYEENVKIAREALSGKNIQLKGGAPVKNSTTYKTNFEYRSNSIQGDHVPLSQSNRLSRPNPVGNWALGKTPMQKTSTYKTNYVNQHVTNCTCDYH